jgi:hypothetical protein
MRNYTVTPEFKTQVTTLLNTKKFSAVFPYMNLINRDGFTYNEQELNSIVQFVGEFPYNEVAEFFQILPNNVKEETGETSSPKMEVVTEEANAETEA